MTADEVVAGAGAAAVGDDIGVDAGGLNEDLRGDVGGRKSLRRGDGDGAGRGARIVDQMEEMGIIGPFEGSKPRQILITRDQWLEMQTTQGTAPTETLQIQTEFADEIDDM